MNATAMIISFILALAVLGALWVLMILNRKRSERFHDQFGPEYDHTVEVMGTEKKAQKAMDDRRKHIESLDIRPLSTSERERYLADWSAVQAKFVDQPGPAVVEADRLIMEVMQVRAYPVSNFEQRAADLSIQYPALVSNYRAARKIANNNKNHMASTEELRQAVVYYRSLFDELLKMETIGPEEKKGKAPKSPVKLPQAA
jgi:hypothetical protein